MSPLAQSTPNTATMSPASGLVDVLALVGVHPHDAAEPLLAARPLIDVRAALGEPALIHPHERQRAVRVFDHLEGHGHGGLLRIGRQRDLLLMTLLVLGKGLRVAVQRRGQQPDHGIQQQLHALVAVGRAQQHRRELQLRHGRPHHVVDQLLRHFFLGQEHLHQLVAVHREGFEHLLPGGAGFVGHLGRDRFHADVLAVGPVEVICLLSHQVDHALKIGPAADRQLHQHGVATQLGAQLLDRLLGIGADAVHLVDECQPGDVIAAHLAVDRQRLGLHAGHGAEHQHGPVQHAEAPLHFDGEIDVAGRVDQVDRGIAPLDLRGGAGDGDAAFLFQLHVVHRGAAATLVVDFLHAVDPAGVVQDALAERGLARVDVGRNPDVTQLG